ncbi:SEC-C metal-binding domain-containing protein [Saliterribacillus persicus]|uniref:SEC-C motif-containing protein n=1 Tax=Saliterribacillus persicus TaxID=930114 RepID=A0A368X569_9BACI|nr:SEC-C metal-binding domain-containing protein [Saliterribacillus persicus]RCW63162.1 SEC-C motif-containing protein [Saliterribacillus persicus]
MTKIGRNDKCPCGSGKKHKKCCVIRSNKSNQFEQWKINASQILTEYPHNDLVHTIFFKTLDFIERKNWAGACHAVSAIQYVLLTEAGLKPRLCVGEVECNIGFFDHSWIEINGKVFDVAIYKNLDNAMAFPPVINGYDISTMKETESIYGAKSGKGFDYNAQTLIHTPFNIYMSGFPDYRNGLWGIVKDLSNECSLNIDIDKRKESYSNTEWLVK